MVPTSSQALVVVVANGAKATNEFTDYKAVGVARRRRSCGGRGDDGADSRIEVVQYWLVIVVEREVGDRVEVRVHLGKKVSFHWEKRWLEG